MVDPRLYNLQDIKEKWKQCQELENRKDYDQREKYIALKTWLFQTIPYLIGRIEGQEHETVTTQTP